MPGNPKYKYPEEVFSVSEKKDIRERVKSLWIKGMKAVGNTAASIANNTRYKVDEVTIQNRRREVLNDLAYKAYALWLKGEVFPEQMDRLLNELKQLDEQLNDMRAEKYALAQKTERKDNEETGTEKADDESEEEEELPFLPAEDSPVSMEINEMFDGVSSVGRSAEKVNTALEQMSERIRRFPQANETDVNGKRQE